MSVMESNMLDGAALSEDGALVMLITDHLDWEDEPAHLHTLQTKMDAYIDYCASGQYLQFTQGQEPKYAIFEIHFLHAPTRTAEDFLNSVQEQIGRMGIAIECHVTT